jgi:glucose-6-phosphate isomerase
VVTSKSGGTSETLVQVLAALEAVKAAGLETMIPKLFLGITEPAAPGKSNGLRTLFAQHGVPMLEHHTGIGGRFSVLTNVGLVPAMARGLDVRVRARWWTPCWRRKSQGILHRPWARRSRWRSAISAAFVPA